MTAVISETVLYSEELSDPNMSKLQSPPRELCSPGSLWRFTASKKLQEYIFLRQRLKLERICVKRQQNQIKRLLTRPQICEGGFKQS